MGSKNKILFFTIIHDPFTAAVSSSSHLPSYTINVGKYECCVTVLVFKRKIFDFHQLKTQKRKVKISRFSMNNIFKSTFFGRCGLLKCDNVL